MRINYDFIQRNEYLTESLLGEFLQEFLSDCEIIHDKIVPGSGIKNRPDFRIEKIKLILEFNGKFHYTDPNVILSDYKKKNVYEGMGYTVKIIPYWIQLRSDVIYFLFRDILNLDISKLKDFNTFPMGFVDDKCPLPSKFCELGILKLNEERNYWEGLIDKFYKYFDFTLLDKILEYDSFLKVANESVLPYFIDLWNNKGMGYSLSIETEKFEGINNEIEMLKKIRG